MACLDGALLFVAGYFFEHGGGESYDLPYLLKNSAGLNGPEGSDQALLSFQ